ncbi:DUF3820 family protein [Granulosicoccaceae sp. 1_MG-2023]|nr:DUF3820 family protein [Granulosicoccaceae sp. 1_MG-2023]
MNKEDLLTLARTPMPFGKYAGRMLFELPEPYLLWFEKKGWPEGRLGQLLALALEIHRAGLTRLLVPLKNENRHRFRADHSDTDAE